MEDEDPQTSPEASSSQTTYPGVVLPHRSASIKLHQKSNDAEHNASSDVGGGIQRRDSLKHTEDFVGLKELYLWLIGVYSMVSALHHLELALKHGDLVPTYPPSKAVNDSIPAHQVSQDPADHCHRNSKRLPRSALPPLYPSQEVSSRLENLPLPFD